MIFVCKFLAVEFSSISISATRFPINDLNVLSYENKAHSPILFYTVFGNLLHVCSGWRYVFHGYLRGIGLPERKLRREYRAGYFWKQAV